MRATRRHRTTAPTGIALGLCALIGFGALACGGSTPMDMWIARDPDAGSGFEPPEVEVQADGEPSDASDSAGSGGAGGDMGTGGAGGDMGAGGTGGGGGDTSGGGAGGGAGAGSSGTGGTST